MGKTTKPYVYDSLAHVLYIDITFWERLSVESRLKILELSEGNTSDVEEPFSLVIQENATAEKYQETFSSVIKNINRVCGPSYNKNW